MESASTAQKTAAKGNLLVDGSYKDLILKLSLPAVVIIMVMIVYNMADTFFIGRTGDPNKVAAVSICLPIFTILSGIGTLFGAGGSTAISIALGQNDRPAIKKITDFCFAGCLVTGVAAWALVFFFTAPIAQLLGTDADTLASTVLYLKTFAFACPFVLFSSAYANILRADGDTVSAMLSNLSGALSNIVLDAVFIMVFHWDVFGAALATVLGNLLASGVVMHTLLKKKQFLLPEKDCFQKAPQMAGRVITLGFPLTIATVLSSVSSMMANRMMMVHGTVPMSALSIALKIGMLITTLIQGFCMGMQPAISYNYGAQNYDRMNWVVRQTLKFTMVLGTILAVFVFCVRDTVVAVFIDNAEVIAYGRMFVLASVLVGPIYGILQTCQNFLQATGKSNYAILVSSLDKGLVYLPVLFILNQMFGAYGIAFSSAVTTVVSVAAAALLALRWKNSLYEM